MRAKLNGLSRGANEYRLGTDNPIAVIELGITSWCNYACSYCVTEVERRRAAASHAFDYHPVERWIDAFARVGCEFSLVCRGGEPFLDHEGFARFLSEVGALPRLRYLRVDTNGSWSPERYASVPESIRGRVQLNVSFHPTQVSLERFMQHVDRIVAAGWSVAMINYVMVRGQKGGYLELQDRFRDRGIYVNPNPDVFDAAWRSDDPVVANTARAEAAQWLPVGDLARKTGAATLGKRCSYPAIGYFVSPDGTAERACGARVAGEPARFDFTAAPERVRPVADEVRCPMAACFCLDRYAFLAELPARGRLLDLLGEYVRDCTAHQRDGWSPGSGAGR